MTINNFLMSYRIVKGYAYSAIFVVILAAIFEYLQIAYFQENSFYIYFSIPLSLSAMIFNYLGYQNLKNHKYQKAIGFVEIIVLIAVLNSSLWLTLSPILSTIDRVLSIGVFIILTLSLIISVLNISYKKETGIIPLDYMNEA